MRERKDNEKVAIYQSHDKLFKAAFGKPAVARDFLINRLPQNVVDKIDMDTLEPQKDSFISNELVALYSDMLYKVKAREGSTNYLYFLIEHQSRPDPHMNLRILEYMLVYGTTEYMKKITR